MGSHAHPANFSNEVRRLPVSSIRLQLAPALGGEEKVFLKSQNPNITCIFEELRRLLLQEYIQQKEDRLLEGPLSEAETEALLKPTDIVATADIPFLEDTSFIRKTVFLSYSSPRLHRILQFSGANTKVSMAMKDGKPHMVKAPAPKISTVVKGTASKH